MTPRLPVYTSITNKLNPSYPCDGHTPLEVASGSTPPGDGWLGTPGSTTLMTHLDEFSKISTQNLQNCQGILLNTIELMLEHLSLGSNT